MYYRRHLQAPLASSTSRGKVRLLFGARQTGKTALLRHLLGGEGTKVFDLQDADLRRRLESDPAALGREIRVLPRGIRAIVIDEVQKVPALLDEVQALHDAGDRRQIYLTGSSARRLRARSANLLPGRSHAFHLFPICGWEVAQDGQYAAIPPPRAGRTAPNHDRPFPAQTLSRTLRFGCLPGVRGEAGPVAWQTLSTYVGTYLEEEIRREAAVRDLGPFSVFLRLAAAESGRQVNLARLSQESGVPASTLRTYYQVLVDTFVGYWIDPYRRPTRKRLLTTPRFLLFDLGVRNAAAELVFAGALPPTEAGNLLEQWVGLELIARAGYYGRGHRVSFWRTTYGAEVDYVWESPREDIPIEVKWTERPRPTDARHLETFLDQYATRSQRGLLVCRCPARQQLTDRVVAVPWTEL